jgi:1,4-dihydroxy-2-naphthoyl-CoA hydrolase
LKRKITLQNTDATGTIYFSFQLQAGVEAFEAFLEESGWPLSQVFKEYGLPIVHVESDYFAPVRIGDEIEVKIFLKSLKTSSFAITSVIKKEGRVVGKSTIVHAVIGAKTGTSMAVPLALKERLCLLSVQSNEAEGRACVEA